MTQLIVGPTDPIGKTPGETAPDGQATNAPLSESNMDGFLFYGCQTAIWYRQPNGFLEISNSVIGSLNNEWPANKFDWNNAAAIQIHHSGSLNVVNCDLECVILPSLSLIFTESSLDFTDSLVI